MKPNTEINWKFAAAFIGFFVMILFVPASDYIISQSLSFIKFADFDTCVAVIYGLIVIAAIVIIFKVGRQIFNNLNNK